MNPKARIETAKQPRQIKQHAMRAERIRIAVRKLPTVAGGRAGAECPRSLQQRHYQAATRKLSGRGYADNPAADDHDPRHLPLRPGGATANDPAYVDYTAAAVRAV